MHTSIARTAFCVSRGGLGIKPLQKAVQKLAASPLCEGTQPVPQLLRAGRAVEQPHENCAQIEPRAADKNRQPRSFFDSRQYAQGLPTVVSCRKLLLGFETVQEVMGNAAALFRREFPRPDVESPVNLHRVVINDFSVQRLSQGQG